MNYTASQIRMRLIQDDRWLIRGLLAIHKLQTYDEQVSRETKHDNGQGFNNADARILSGLVDFYKSRNFLSQNQIAVARERMLKYSNQLTKIANQKGN